MMSKVLEFNEENKVSLSKEEVLSFIDNEKKVTIIFGNGFDKNSDTEDVFRGIMSDIGFEESIEMMDAMDCGGEVKLTLYICNDDNETPFNERGMAKRLIKDNYWTSIILHDHPIKDGLYAMIKKK